MATGEVKALRLIDGVTVTAPTPTPSFAPGASAGGLRWVAPSGVGALATEELNNEIFLFPDAADVELWALIEVPEGYVAGNPIAIKVGIYSPSTSGTVKMLATSYLVEEATDAVTTTTDSYPSTNAAITNTVANQLRVIELDLTSSTGTINGTAVAPLDMIKVKLTRDYANDTDTAAVRVMANVREVLWA